MPRKTKQVILKKPKPDTNINGDLVGKEPNKKAIILTKDYIKNKLEKL